MGLPSWILYELKEYIEEVNGIYRTSQDEEIIIFLKICKMEIKKGYFVKDLIL